LHDRVDRTDNYFRVPISFGDAAALRPQHSQARTGAIRIVNGSLWHGCAFRRIGIAQRCPRSSVSLYDQRGCARGARAFVHVTVEQFSSHRRFDGILAVGLSANFGLANTIVQERAPAALRGRVSAVFGLSFLA